MMPGAVEKFFMMMKRYDPTVDESAYKKGMKHNEPKVSREY